MKHRCLIVLAALIALEVTWSRPTHALPITFTGSSGTLAAQVDFDVSGSNLIVTLTNTSTADVLVPTNVLTAVFFNIVGDPALARVSAVVAAGSTVLFGTTDPGNVVGGEVAYKNGLVGAPGASTQGLSTVGLGLFGAGDRFPGNDLQPPASPDGVQYGLTSAGDDPTTGNTPVTGTQALIQNALVMTLAGLPTNFTLDDISNVWFQYGTALDEPSFPGKTPGPGGGTVPLPSTLPMLGTGVLALLYARRR